MNRAFLLALLAITAAPAQEKPVNQRRVIQALADAGKLDEAERSARALGAPFAATLGGVLVMRGKLAAADSAFRLAISTPTGRDKQMAEISLAELAQRRGDRPEAFRRADAVAAAYERDRSKWSSDDREAAGRAYLLLGTTRNWIQSALAAFDDAVATDSTNLNATLWVGDLFLSKFVAPEARDAYNAVLRRAPNEPYALLGIARVSDFEDSANAMQLVERAVALNPSLVPGLLAIARTHLEAESFDSARVYVNRALAVDSSSSTAWALLGAGAWIMGDSVRFRAALTSAQKLNPRPAEFYEEVADAAVRNRRYADAMKLARQAIDYDSASVRALAILGNNQLRMGDVNAGRMTLDRAFKADPYNLWNKNTLDLLDRLATFKTIDSGHFRIVAPPEEAQLLATYLIPLLEEAYDTLSKRYDYKPPTPIRLEIYRSHADFSVRTVGLAGLGALGVSFGTTLAMDSPMARDKGSFSWGSTAWHELTHTFTLGRSDNRVPRWLSEGLSVFEERRARPSWGADATVEFLAAYKGNAVRKVSELSEGFVHPRYAQELQFSYYDASLVCEMIYAERGSAGLVALLSVYKQGLSTPVVFQRVLGTSMDAFDKKFDAWVRARFAVPLKSIEASNGRSEPKGEYVRALVEGAALVERQQYDSAKAVLEHGESLFPDYAGSHSPAWYLAQIALRQGDAKAAVAQLGRITTQNETAWDANEMEVRLREQLDDRAGAAVALQRMIWIWPADPGIHEHLADLSTELHDYRRAVRERQAILALAPSDRMEARYQLAKALQASGDISGARREILGVLEQAPSFDKALRLLLELRKQTPEGRTP